MKSFLLLVLILTCLFTKAQEPNSTKIIEFNLPQGSEKPSRENIQRYLNTRKNTKVNLKNYDGLVYKIGESILKIKAINGVIKADQLETQKKAYDSAIPLYKEAKNYSSEIKLTNNYKLLIIKYDLTDYSYYNFSANNQALDKAMAGTLEYKKTDEAKAKAIIDYLLKNLKFK